MKFKVAVVLTLISLLTSLESFAAEYCAVGAGIDNEDGHLTYITGIGANGAVPKPIKAMNSKVRAALESAAEKMSPEVLYCMKGKINHGTFEVESIEEKKVK